MKLGRTLSMLLALAGASTASIASADPPANAPPPAKAPPGKAELGKADVEKLEQLVGELHGAIVKNQDACPKMGGAIDAVLDKHMAWLQEVAASGKDLPQASKDRMQKQQGEVMSGVMKCKDDKRVQDAMRRFAAVGAKKAPAKK